MTDLINDIPVNAAAIDLIQIAINNVRTGTCDVKIRFDQSGDKRCQTAYLSPRAETEQISCSLIFPDLFDIFRRQFHICLIKIQCSVKITSKYFFHMIITPIL